jgi:hypothetical protein
MSLSLVSDSLKNNSFNLESSQNNSKVAIYLSSKDYLYL